MAKVVLGPLITVSIHAPARGRTGKKVPILVNYMFQSTPPRGGELSTPNFVEKKSQIALHRVSATFSMTRQYHLGADSLQLI